MLVRLCYVRTGGAMGECMIKLLARGHLVEAEQSICFLRLFFRLLIVFWGGFRPIYYLRHCFSCSFPIKSRSSDPGAHSRLFAPHPPLGYTTIRALHCDQPTNQKGSALSSFFLRALASNYATRTFIFLLCSAGGLYLMFTVRAVRTLSINFSIKQPPFA